MINKVILVGNVGADPDVRTLETGTKVARVRIATTERIFNRQTQETKEHTEWHSIVFWRGLADVVDKYVRKGGQIYVEGALRSNDWTDKDGNKRYGVEIVASELKMLGGRREGTSGGGSGASGGGNYGGSGNSGGSYGGGSEGSAPAPASASEASSSPASSVQEPSSQPPVPVDDLDDLPF